ncbi:MAG: DEAD/DEAH box helicase, partial [Bacteroidota bacterium]
PEAFIVNYRKDRTLGYIQQRAIVQTIESYELEYSAVHQKLLKIIDLTHEKTIVEKFNSKKGRKKTLAILWEEPSVKKAIRMHLDRQLDQFFSEIVKHQLPLTRELERKAYAPDFLLQTNTQPLEPQLYFQKTANNMRYRLSMLKEGRKVAIPQHQVIPLVNEPAWAIWAAELVQIAHINGLMLKPFVDKEEVLIPARHVKTYFEKFVLKVASKVELQTDGFEVKKYHDIQKVSLRLSENFLQKNLQLSLSFEYLQAKFDYKDQQQQHTRLEFLSGEEVIIHRSIRNETEEAIYVRQLLDLGLKENNSKTFQLADNQENSYALLHWLIQHQKQLQTLGFEVQSPQIQQKKIATTPHQLSLNVTQGNDWFDLFGVVQVGEISIPFTHLFPYIKANDPFYPLADGTYFFIPEEWMERYKALAEKGKTKGKKSRFPKSLYTLLEDKKEIENVQEVLDVEAMEAIKYQPSKWLKADLRPYQLEGVKWLVQHYHNHFGACLADDMGLGKTLQTIAVLLYAKENQPKEEQTVSSTQQLGLFENALTKDYYSALNALVILPASLVFNWESEIKKFAPQLQVLKYLGTKRKAHQKLLHNFDVVLTTYQTALRDVEVLKKYDFSYLILDESQYIKNKNSKIFQAIKSIKAAHKISLSGTPIENSLADLWAQMQFINPDILGSFQFFKQHYQIPIEKQEDEVQKEELRRIIQPFLLRRTKEEVAKDLPELTTQVFYSEMSNAQQKIYEREKSAARNYLLDNFQTNNGTYHLKVLQSLTKLRQIANHPILCDVDYEGESAKFTDVQEQLDRIQRSGHKALIFSSFTKHLALFQNHFQAESISYSLLQGDQSQKQRQQAVKAFQETSDVPFFLISLKAGGTGLNLTAADYVFILDPWWNPQAEQQAIARAHRIGQDKRVFATKFITKATIEEKILRLQERKSRLAEDIIAGGKPKSFSRDDLRFLFG